jgi:hypothetical protein
MEMTFVGTTSHDTGCPTLWVTDRGTVVIQGTTVTDPEALAAMRARGNGLPDYESAVEVPAELLPFVDVTALQTVPFGNDDRPPFLVHPEAASKIAALGQ